MVPDIALMGGMGAGKTTVADYLVKAHNYKALKISEPIYHMAGSIWGPEARTNRSLLQELGMKIREIDPDAWLNMFLRRCDEVEDQPIVNDTLRMPNEYWALKQRGFVIIRVLAREALRQDRLMRDGRIQDNSEFQHETETALIGLEATKQGIHEDFTIYNDGDVTSLYDQVESVLGHIEEGY